LLGTDWYFGLIKKYVAIFGTLFNDINIIRTDSSNNVVGYIKVPLTYSPKDKMAARINQDPNIAKQAAIVLPAIGFEMGSPRYDPDRQLNKRQVYSVIGDDPDHFNTQFMPAPFIFPFKLSVFCNTPEDGTKIVEQIYPMFRPEFTVSAELVPEMGITIDIPICYRDTELVDNWNEKDMKETRLITYTLSFDLKGYFYGPKKPMPVIKFIVQNFRTNQDITIPSDLASVVTDQPGLDANGNPTSNLAVSVNAHTIWVNSNYGFIETKSTIIIPTGNAVPFDANTPYGND
jgi:T4-like virus Myoviridae tail sheath stabiliser